MFLASASTKRPIAMTCLLIALIILGLNAYRKMSIEDLPAVDIPYVTVVTTWVGASPEDIEKDVSKHIEDAVSGIDGLKHIQSSSLENVSQVTLEFNMGIDVDVAAQDVREKLDVVIAELPEAADRPVIQKVNLNASAVANIFISGSAPIDDIYDYADNKIADRFATVSGVAEVQVVGGNEREVWIELDRDRLAAAGLTSLDIVGSLQKGILSLPGGRLNDSGAEYSIRFDAEYENFDEIGELEVANKNGARLKLKDLGTIRQATEKIRQRAILDGKQGITLKIIKKAEGNVVSVVKSLKKRFEEVKKDLPGGMEITWVSDESANINASIDSAVSSVFQAIIICAFILLVFLANFRTTVIVAITMPVTILISLFFMQISGQSLNTATLLAIGLSTGVLVSNSIVVLESVVTKMTEIDNKWEAASIGASEVTVSVLASAGTNVIVMFPVALMTSLVGKILVPFALTSLIVNSVSIFISFTLTPILCAMLLNGKSEKSLSAVFSAHWTRNFNRAGRAYAQFIGKFTKNRFACFLATIGFAALFFFSIKIAGGKTGISFFENEDLGRVFVRVEFPPYYNFEKTVQRIDGIQRRLLEFSDLEHVMTTAGKAESQSGQANEGVYMGQIELFFKTKTERAWNMNDRLAAIRKLLVNETDCIISASTPGKMGGQSFQIDYKISGDDLGLLETAATNIKTESLKLSTIGQLDTTVRDSKPEIKVQPKRAVLADMHITAATVGSLVRANIDGIEAANYKKGDRTYDIRVKLAEVDGKEQIRQFMLPGADGRPVPLESVADVVDSRSTLQIYRVDKQRSVKLLGDITKGATMGGVSKQIANIVAEKDLLPPGYEMKTSGMNEMMDEMAADFVEAISLAALLTILILCAILESWIRPAIVLLTLPMGLIGVLWGLALSHNAITVFVFLGILMLIGIVVNAAILIVDKMGQLISTGMDSRSAIIAALEDQFRPVLMVVLASGLGMLPIALSTGIGSENRCGMGIASAGGIIVAGVLTITVLPLIYSLFIKSEKPAKPVEHA